MTEAEIYLQLTGVFRAIFDDENIVITPETMSDDISEWDSFNHIKLVVAVERQFKLKFTTSQLEGMKDVGEMVDIIKRKQAAEAVRA